MLPRRRPLPLAAVVPAVLVAFLLGGCQLFESDPEPAEGETAAEAAATDQPAGSPEAAVLAIPDDRPGPGDAEPPADGAQAPETGAGADAMAAAESTAGNATGETVTGPGITRAGPQQAAAPAGRIAKASMIDAGIGVVTDLFVLGNDAIVGTRTGFNYRVESFRSQYALIPVPEIAGRQPEPTPVGVFEVIPQSRGVGGAGSVSAAWLVAPTDRYSHGVLGDRFEAGGLLVRLLVGAEHLLDLPDSQVFEDLTPRITDLDGDGASEVLVVRTSLTKGASLVLYGAGPEGLFELAATDPIGLPNRWLNPVGAGDFDGDGTDEVAYVETPHIGGILRVLDYSATGFREIASASGFSNHQAGSPVLGLSAVVDWDGDGADDIVVPSADRTEMVVMSLKDGSLTERGRASHGAEIATPVVVANVDGDRAREVVYGLADGRIIVLDD